MAPAAEHPGGKGLKRRTRPLLRHPPDTPSHAATVAPTKFLQKRRHLIHKTGADASSFLVSIILFEEPCLDRTARRNRSRAATSAPPERAQACGRKGTCPDMP